MKWRLDAGQIEVVDDAVAEILRKKTPAERIAMTASLWRTGRLLVETLFQIHHQIEYGNDADRRRDRQGYRCHSPVAIPQPPTYADEDDGIASSVGDEVEAMARGRLRAGLPCQFPVGPVQ